MIKKHIVDIFILVLYWGLINPCVFIGCKSAGWIKWDPDNLMSSVSDYCVVLIALTAGYLVVYFIVVCIYLRVQTWSLKAFYNYETTTVELMNRERAFYRQQAVEQEFGAPHQAMSGQVAATNGKKPKRPAPAAPPSVAQHMNVQPEIHCAVDPPSYEDINLHV
ncbi:maker461 [Drosophila busckii]|uniref:Maker460 n=1 Tax=Drosophila busckii TaxID=30019 RepID=A0A0M4E1A2_DROBS|nr:maker460 [Drosophila busckii]ALC39104.1 maker461 [Drosophila busckii]